MITITDADDPRLGAFRKNDRELSNRSERRNDDAPGNFLAEGDLVVERALDAGCRPVAALVDIDGAPIVTARFIAELSRLGDHDAVFAAGASVRRHIARMGRVQPIIAVFERPPRPAAAEILVASCRVVVLEAVDNPSNVGAIVRNAAALGWGGIILDHTSADPLARRSLRVAMGTAFAVPHARTNDLAGTLASMAAWGWMTVALSTDRDGVDLDDIDPRERCAIVIGAERAGLTEATAAACSHRARIPMNPEVNSLNAAAATAIACYQLRSR